MASASRKCLSKHSCPGHLIKEFLRDSTKPMSLSVLSFQVGLQIMTLILFLRQNFHVICWTLCTKKWTSLRVWYYKFLLRNQSVDFMLEKLCCLWNPAMSLGRGGYLVRCELLTWSPPEHTWAPVLTDSSTASSSSLASQVLQVLWGRLCFPTGVVQCAEHVGREHKRQLCAVCPSIPEMAGHLIVTWSNSLEIMLTKDICLKSCCL